LGQKERIHISLESKFQSDLIQDLKRLFPGCMILKNDPVYVQGIPDLIILWGDRWASLEVKRSKVAHVQPNQEWYVSKMDQMSFSRFIYPENRQITLFELEFYFTCRREEEDDDY
jgi:hypothetical protein